MTFAEYCNTVSLELGQVRGKKIMQWLEPRALKRRLKKLEPHTTHELGPWGADGQQEVVEVRTVEGPDSSEANSSGPSSGSSGRVDASSVSWDWG